MLAAGNITAAYPAGWVNLIYWDGEVIGGTWGRQPLAEWETREVELVLNLGYPDGT